MAPLIMRLYGSWARGQICAMGGSMNKRQARAILACSSKILDACDQCERNLAGWGGLENARVYWLSHLRSIANGEAYGSMPVNQANDVINL